MAVDFGIGLRARHPRQLVALTAEAVAAGFDHIWLYDSPRFAETWVAMTWCALNAPATTVGSLVTNVEMRDPTVTANAAATLSHLTGGRIALGVGLGDSAVKFIGKRPTSFADFRGRVELLRALLHGEAVTCNGRTLSLSAPPHTPPPILITAEGPKTFEYAGAACDGAIISPGSSPRFLRYAIARIREGAIRAGRDPALLYICAQAHCSIAATEDQAIRELVGALNRTLYRYVMRVPYQVLGLDKPFVPDALSRRAPELTSRQEEELRGTEEIRAAMGDELLRELAVVGTPDTCRRKLRELRAVEGVSQLIVNIHARDRSLTLKLVRGEIPARRGRGPASFSPPGRPP